MSISSQLLILNQTKGNIKTSINNKGVSVTDEPFAEYPDKVRLIPSGTGTYESQIILWIEGRLKNVVIPNGTTKIGDYTFSYFPSTRGEHVIETVSMPNTVTEIGQYAFSHCEALHTINLSTNLETIGSCAFLYCESLTSVIFPQSVRTLGDNAFGDCESLTNITLNEGLETIGNGVFLRCNITGDVTIPSSVRSIGQGNFGGGQSITSLIFLSSIPPTLNGNGSSWFTGSYPIYVPDSSVLAYQTATNWINYADRIKGISEKPQ